MIDPWTNCDEILLGRYRDQVLWSGLVVRLSPTEMSALRSFVVGRPGAERVRGAVIPMSTRRLLHHGLFESEDGRGGGVLALPHGDTALEVARDIATAAGRPLVDVVSRIRRSTKPSRGARANPAPGCCVRNSDEELRRLERAARGGDPAVAARWVAARLRRGEVVTGRELVGLGLATGLRDPVMDAEADRQILDSAHLAFNRQTTRLSRGQVSGGTQSSSFIRPWNETVNPVGQTVPPGHLTRFDLNSVTARGLHPVVRKFVEDLARQDRETILHRFYVHGRRGEEPRTLGWVVTSGDRSDEYRLLGLFYSRGGKAQSAVETAAQYVAWEPLAGYFEDRWPSAMRHYRGLD